MDECVLSGCSRSVCHSRDGRSLVSRDISPVITCCLLQGAAEEAMAKNVTDRTGRQSRVASRSGARLAPEMGMT